MRNWILMFRPDTYEIVKERGVIGVLFMHRRRFAEVAEGDRFVAYLSQRQVFDGHGRIASAPYSDVEPIFPGRDLYPQRARVTFEHKGASVPAAKLLWDLDLWAARAEPLKTSPWNMLYCYGGFMEVPDTDFGRLRGVVAG